MHIYVLYAQNTEYDHAIDQRTLRVSRNKQNKNQVPPFECSITSSSTFSSSTKSFCSSGMLSSSFGIRIVEFSLSFSKSTIFDESWQKSKLWDKMHLVHTNKKCIWPTFSSLSVSFLIFCFMCFKSSLYLTSSLSNCLNSSLHDLSSPSSSYIINQ